MSNEQAEVLIEELLQLKLEVVALRSEAKRTMAITGLPLYICAAAALAIALWGAWQVV